jgi:hypothetical protein
VSPADTLRSLTTPSNGARTSVRRSCWRADTTRARAATRSLCALLRRISASSSACIEHHALRLQRLQALHLALGLVEGLRRGTLRLLGRAEAVADRGVVQPHQQVAGAHRSPFSFGTCSTTAETSARRSARRSGWIEPVITGPWPASDAPTRCRSSGAISSVAAAAAAGWSAPCLPQATSAAQAARVKAKEGAASAKYSRRSDACWNRGATRELKSK